MPLLQETTCRVAVATRATAWAVLTTTARAKPCRLRPEQGNETATTSAAAGKARASETAHRESTTEEEAGKDAPRRTIACLRRQGTGDADALTYAQLKTSPQARAAGAENGSDV